MGCGGVAPASVPQPVRVPVSHSFSGRGPGGFRAAAARPGLPGCPARRAHGCPCGHRCPGPRRPRRSGDALGRAAVPGRWEQRGEPCLSARSVFAAAPSAVATRGTQRGELLAPREMPRGAAEERPSAPAAIESDPARGQ